jgi:hypothetical protein
MQRVKTAGAPGGFNINPDGNPATNDATVVTDTWLNDIQEEICTVITDPTGGNAALNETLQNQLLTAIKAIVTRNSFAAGTRMVFAQNTAPVGWTIDATKNDMNLRVVSSAASGYVTGGIHSPTIMNVVPAHTHGIVDSTNTTTAAGTHTHADTFAATSSTAPAHDHNTGTFNRMLRAPYVGSLTGFDTTNSGSEQAVGAGDSGIIQPDGAHAHTITITGGITAVGNHTHNLSINVTTTSQTPTADNWEPKYLNVILCTKN